ncbi:transcription and mRNA export factor ENY2-like [Psammomys obesus]|uniref:transcription and mRNA export factor ENY2-like n=1 Tax=Psammomys obesus TaxID=48139 RepID=UPI002453278F|nr:transcription and mRNA export factor ENY2-like [Psammomys obesus]
MEVSKMHKDEMRAAINQGITETGGRAPPRAAENWTECGWEGELRAHCKEVVKEKGPEHVPVDDLVAEITPKGRALACDNVKTELLRRLRTFFAQHASLQG